MKIIRPASKISEKILSKQTITTDSLLRPICYSIIEDVPEGELISNLITGEIILRESGEDVHDYMVSNWYLVPQDFDEHRLVGQLREVRRLINMGMRSGIRSYTVLTTTDCNARCFYCYEAGCEKQVMDRNTAIKAADYIAAHLPTSNISDEGMNYGGSGEHLKGQDGKVHLAWFGGEPTYNAEAIDTICEQLSERGIEYFSTMTSNGYLLDEEMVDRAVKLWKLKRVQITLDGTEPIYNERKAYIYDDESPYSRVLHNIHILLSHDIRVNIRLNLDEENYEDLNKLIEDLHDMFADESGLTVYSHVIFQYEQGEDTRAAALYEKNRLLTDRMVEYGLHKDGYDIPEMKYVHCMADNPYAAVILPDGSLKSCQHIVVGRIWGSIYDDSSKQDIGDDGESELSYWQETAEEYDKCRSCRSYPVCCKLKNCPDAVRRCSDRMQDDFNESTRKSVLRLYEKYAEH